MTNNSKIYLDSLNNPQKKAVINTEGSYLILAGAGSGKTRVLTYRLFHLLLEKKALIGQILAVTFTNKAASEMKMRVASLLGRPIDSMWLGTFHSLSAKILRNHANLVGLKSNFIIIDKDDQLKIVKQICERDQINIKEKTPKYYLKIIDNYKNKSVSNNFFIKNNKDKDIGLIFNKYQSELLRLNCVDFGDLIIHCIRIFKKNKEVLEKYQNQFKYILVDEYQDINTVQQKWLELLYLKNKNICCVGDDDQSIYSWRGADISNLLSFEKNFPNSTIMRLEQNYRSSQNILDCAASLIDKNKNRYGKKLWSEKDKGEKIIISGFWETKDEAMFVSDQIEKLLTKNTKHSEIAILFRVAAHTRSFEERFINIGLPYKIIGGLRFYERREIKDAIAYLRLVNNYSDDLAFERIINVPKRGIGKKTLNKINIISRTNNISMYEASEIFINESNGSNLELSLFLNNFTKWNKYKKEVSHYDLLQVILEDSKYIQYLQQESKLMKDPENLTRIDNINELIESLKDFENLEGFLEHVGLVMENISNTSKENINLMTIHSAKGLEFDNLFLAGWEEGVFPSKKSIEELGQKGLEEERRLAYVALTRAKKKINITYVNQNRYSYASHDYNIPSRFIDDLPKKLIEITDSSFIPNNDFIDEFVNSDDISDEVLTPGRKRMLSNSSFKEIEWNLNQDENNEYNLTKGQKVFHKKYGYGIVTFIEGEVAEVDFKKSSQKQVFLKYLEIIN